MKPTQATSSGERSGGHAEDRQLRDRGQLQDPADQADQGEPDDGARLVIVIAVASEVGVRLGQHLDHVEPEQVGGGLDVDAAVEVAVAEVDPATRCRSGSPAG